MNTTPMDSPAAQRDLLLAALNLSYADLLANRAGQVSPAQRAYIRRLVPIGRYYAGALALSLLATGILLFFSLQGHYTLARLREVGGWVGELGLVWAVVCVLGVMPLHRAIARLGRARVRAVDDVVRSIVKSPSLMGRVYFIRTGTMLFYIKDERPLRGLTVGSRYRFYYAPYYNQPFLFAAEPIATV